MNINDTKSMDKYLGKAIKIMRLDRRLTQAQFVSLADGALTQGNFSKIEQGKIFPSKKTLTEILKVLKCTPEELWNRAETFMDSPGSWEEEDVEELLFCLQHDSLGLDSEKIRVIRTLVSKGDVFNSLFRDYFELRAEIRCNMRSQGNLERIHRLKDMLRCLPFETVEQVIVFSELFTTLLIEAAVPQSAKRVPASQRKKRAGM